MNKPYHQLIALACTFLLTASTVFSQNNQENNVSNYQQVNTYVNPVLPGDHPDPTMIKVGNDFYHCGSSFHFTPYLPIYHSKDLVHWEVISRVMYPAKSGFVTDRPSGGIWQGAITYFYGSWWVYFSANGQHFCKANSPYGPWSDAVEVKTNPATGNLGYDNSIFVDDNGKPYMVIKNGQKINRLQAIGKDGQLTDTVINLDWMNASLQYSWAEGPVMCKRNGYYFYFPAGDVSGGQYVLRTKELTSDSTKWERLGDFFKPVTDTHVGFRRPNHISAPIQLEDGTWWTLGQSYEKYDGNDWSGTGRQTSLYPVIWEGDRPWGMAPTTQPITKPNLPQSNILWRSVTTDYFEKDTLNYCWHFLSKKDFEHFSLTAKKGWLTLTPDNTRTSIVQKETDHYYTAVTKVDVDAIDAATKAGIYLSNGNQKVVAELYAGFDNGKKIIFKMDTAVCSIENKAGNIVWLKLERYEHNLTAYYSGDGVKWIALGTPISAVHLDKEQPSWNSWVGTSVGLFAEGKPAGFDFFVCKDGLSPIPSVSYSNYYGVEKVETGTDKAVTNTTNNGGWFMISGVEFGKENDAAKRIEITSSFGKKGTVEIWLDDLKNGKLIATVPITQINKKQWNVDIKEIKTVYGQHDVFIKFPTNNKNGLYIKEIRFLK